MVILQPDEAGGTVAARRGEEAEPQGRQRRIMREGSEQHGGWQQQQPALDIGAEARHDDPCWERKEWRGGMRSEEHTSALQSLMRSSYAVFCLKKQKEHSDR